MDMTPIVGQQLFMLNVGNAARHTPQTLRPVTVTKVGRLYFTVCHDTWTTQFSIDGWQQKTDYSVDYALYTSEQQWADEKESAKICEDIEKLFRYGHNPNLSIAVLRKISELISTNTL